MTARAQSTFVVDASTVYAEGVYAGVKSALSILRRTSGAEIPHPLRKLLHEWECNVVHNEWMAQHGRPVPLQQDAAVRSLISLTLTRAGLSVLSDDD